MSIFGATGRTRTGDLLITNQLLYRLSHSSDSQSLFYFIFSKLSRQILRKTPFSKEGIYAQAESAEIFSLFAYAMEKNKSISVLGHRLAFVILTIEIPNFLGTAGMAQLPDRLVFNLANTFSGYSEILAYFFQRVGLTVFHTKAQPQNLSLSIG